MRIAILGEPEFETVAEHGGECPHGYITIMKAEGYGVCGYVPYDSVERDDLGLFITTETPFIDSGGR